MEIRVHSFRIRSWWYTDAESLAKYANNRKIWLNLRDAFPSPYTLEDAKDFIQQAMARNPETYFAIDIEGNAIGSIGYVLNSDVERISAESSPKPSIKPDLTGRPVSYFCTRLNN